MKFFDEYKYETPLCAAFSISLLFQLSYIQIFSLEPLPQTPSIYALPLVWETKFHTLTKQLAEPWFFIC
jgi:hypothetical protein